MLGGYGGVNSQADARRLRRARASAERGPRLMDDVSPRARFVAQVAPHLPRTSIRSGSPHRTAPRRLYGASSPRRTVDHWPPV